MADDPTLIEELIATRLAPGAWIIGMHERPTGAQGYSGAALHYYDVTHERSGIIEQVAIVTKPSSPTERRALAWLGERGLPVPRSHTRDLATESAALVAMEHAGDPPPSRDKARLVASALAAIHHAALGRADKLPWLPRADPAFFAETIVGHWRKRWRHLLTGAGYTDWYGRWQTPQPGGDPFWAQFAEYDAPLEAAAARFIDAMTALWAEGDALTLIHADFHDDNVRWHGGRAAIIDWEQACYGPLYIDLPNYFAQDGALLYRDALAALGHDIPPARFLAHCAATSHYIGFKYFGFGVIDQRPNGPPRRREDALYWIDLALHGASRGRPNKPE